MKKISLFRILPSLESTILKMNNIQYIKNILKLRTFSTLHNVRGIQIKVYRENELTLIVVIYY